MPKQLTIEKRDKIRQALKDGTTKDEIASTIHCSKTTINKVENGDYDDLENRIVSNNRIVSIKKKSGLASKNQPAGPDFGSIKPKDLYRKALIKATFNRAITRDESEELFKLLDVIFK